MAGKCKDLTGYVTESGVTVLRRVENKGTKPQWECQCFCGNIFVTRADGLKSGHTKSCGCLQKQKASSTITAYNQSLALDLTNQRFGKLIAQTNTHKPCQGGTSLIWECLCDCGNVCYVSAHRLTSGTTQSCGCLISKGEAKIHNILQAHNIIFETQKQFDSCILKQNIRARFDFFLPEHNAVIEYDGNVHFQTNNSGWNTEENLREVQERDKLKTQWCLNNNIILIRVPYTHYNALDINDLLPETSNFIITNGEQQE